MGKEKTRQGKNGKIENRNELNGREKTRVWKMRDEKMGKQKMEEAKQRKVDDGNIRKRENGE